METEDENKNDCLIPEGSLDEDKYADDMAPGQSVDMDSRTRITVRNLRIREDTAKYLHNLDPNAAHYDPKSRSMRENPFAVLFYNHETRNFLKLKKKFRIFLGKKRNLPNLLEKILLGIRGRCKVQMRHKFLLGKLLVKVF